MVEDKNEGKELEVLHHDAWPHFRKAFVVIFILFSAYLALILLSGGDVGGAGH